MLCDEKLYLAISTAAGSNLTLNTFMSIIKPIVSWRGIFAISIVCFHFAMHAFDQMTYAGVTFFFMLSGFLVCYNQASIQSVKKFYGRRLRRLFPLHWLSLGAIVVLDLFFMHKFTYGWDLPLHVSLLQSWVPNEAVYYNYSIHSWFLSSMLFCVLATPFLFYVFSRLGRKVAWIVVALVGIAVAVLCVLADSTLMSYYYVFPVFRAFDYSLGMMLGLSLRNRKPLSLSFGKATLVEVGALLVFALFIAFHASGNAVASKLEVGALWWVPMLLLIAVCALLNGSEGAIGKLLSLQPLLWLGGISFEIYILQKAVNNLFCYVVAPFCGHFGLMIYDYSFVGTVVLLLLLSYLVHRFFTIPISRFHVNKRANRGKMQ